jgi:hypothetical protein
MVEIVGVRVRGSVGVTVWATKVGRCGSIVSIARGCQDRLFRYYTGSRNDTWCFVDNFVGSLVGLHDRRKECERRPVKIYVSHVSNTVRTIIRIYSILDKVHQCSHYRQLCRLLTRRVHRIATD